MCGHEFFVGEDVYFVFSKGSGVDVVILEEVLVIDLNAVYLIPFSKLVLPLGEVILPANNQNFFVCVLSVGVMVD